MIDVLLVTGLGIGAATTITAIQIIEDGASPSTGLQGGLLGATVGAVIYLERRRRTDQATSNMERRESSAELLRQLKHKDKRIERLEARLDELTDLLVRKMEELAGVIRRIESITGKPEASDDGG